MKKLLFIFLLAGALSVFGMDIKEERVSEDVYCLDVHGKKCVINEVIIKFGEGNETLVPAAVLKRLNSAYISAALRWNLIARAVEEKIMPDEVDLSKRLLLLDLPNISSSSFSLIMSLIGAENQTRFLKSLSEEEIKEIFINLDFLQADEELLASVIRVDVSKKQAWKNYDGSEDALRDYVHNEKYKEILKGILVQTLGSTHFLLSKMKEKRPVVLMHEGEVASVVIATDNSFVVTGSADGTAKIWKLNEEHDVVGEPVTLTGHEGEVTSVVIATDNSFVVTGSADGTAKIWKLNEEHDVEGEPIALMNGAPIDSVVLASDNSFVVTRSVDREAKIWKLNEKHYVEGEPIALMNGAPVDSVVLASDNSFIVTGSTGGALTIWNLNENREFVGEPITVQRYDHPVTGDRFIRTVVLASDNSFIVTGAAGGALTIWKLNENHEFVGEPITLDSRVRGYNWGASAVVLASDNSFIVTRSGDGEIVKIWKLNENHEFVGEPIALGDRDFGFAVALASDNSFVVTGSGETVKIWRLNENHEASVKPIDLKGHIVNIRTVALASDDSFIVAGATFGGTVLMWRRLTLEGLEIPQLLLLLKLATSESKFDLTREPVEMQVIYESLPEEFKTTDDEETRRLPKSWWSKIKRPLAVGSIIAAAYLGYKLFNK
jgi:WD40 repeat protein